MTRKQFLRVATVMIAVIVTIAFGVSTARAQCLCGPIHIDIDLEVMCSVPLTVWCNDGTMTDLNGGLPYPPGTRTMEPCPCPGAVITQISLGPTGPVIPVPTPGFYDITVGDCCLRFDIHCDSGGGMMVRITRSPLC